MPIIFPTQHIRQNEQSSLVRCQVKWSNMQRRWRCWRWHNLGKPLQFKDSDWDLILAKGSNLVMKLLYYRQQFIAITWVCVWFLLRINALTRLSMWKTLFFISLANPNKTTFTTNYSWLSVISVITIKIEVDLQDVFCGLSCLFLMNNNSKHFILFVRSEPFVSRFSFCSKQSFA